VRIEGLGCVVTGGASGLGAATARELIRAGGRVALLDLPRSDGDKVAAEMGENAVFYSCDVTDEEQVAKALGLADSAFGGIRIAISCAGIGWAQRTLTREGAHPLGPFRKLVDVNVIGTFNVIRLAAERISGLEPLATGERGVLINTASVAAYDGQIGQVAYAATKGAVVGMTLPVARDLAGLGIRCVTIAPGLFDTPLLAGLPEPARSALSANVPFPKRLGQPSEYALLARAIIENPMLNGETIRLDGALRMPPKG